MAAQGKAYNLSITVLLLTLFVDLLILHYITLCVLVVGSKAPRKQLVSNTGGASSSSSSDSSKFSVGLSKTSVKNFAPFCRATGVMKLNAGFSPGILSVRRKT